MVIRFCRRRALLALGAATLAFGGNPAWAQGDRNLRLIVKV